MGNDNKKKKEPWRIAVCVLSIAYIIFMWVKKDIASICATMPPEQVAPLIATTVAVFLLKLAVLAGIIFLVKWIAGKITKQ